MDFYVLDAPRPNTSDTEAAITLESSSKKKKAAKILKTMIDSEGIRGACNDFHSRKLITREEVEGLSYEDILNKFGARLFVMVATQIERNQLLFPDNVNFSYDLPILSYCILEQIGRSRFNGERMNGEGSLVDIFTEQFSMFHHKKVLGERRLVCQPEYAVAITERRLFLPRFFRNIQPPLLSAFQQFYQMVKNSPSSMLQDTEIANFFKDRFDTSSRKWWQQSLKQLGYEKAFEFQRIPYRQLYPDAKQKEYTMKNGKAERTIRVVVAKDFEVEKEKAEKDEDSDDETEFLDISNQYVRVDWTTQILMMIRDCGQEGATLADIKKGLGLPRLMIRGTVKRLVTNKLIKFYMVEVFRQKVMKYILYETESADKEFDILMKELTSRAAFPGTVQPPPDTADLLRSIDYDMGIQSLHVEIRRNFLEEYKMASDKNSLTQRMAQRVRMLLEIITEQGVVRGFSEIFLMITKIEDNQGSKEKICRKTIPRLVRFLSQMNLVVTYDITFTSPTRTKVLHIVCDGKRVSFDDPRVDEMIHCLKETLVDDCKIPEKQIVPTIVKPVVKSLLSTEKPIDVTAPKGPLQPLVYSAKLHHTPKFQKLRDFHKFLFYVSNELPIRAEPLNIDFLIKESWENELEMDLDGIRPELPAVYSKNIDWKMFIHPLRNETEPPGWVQLEELLVRMPLSIFLSTCRQFYEIPNFENFKDHPIKKHLLVGQLPDEMKSILFHKRKYVQEVCGLIYNLCHMGLARLGPSRTLPRKNFYVYVNRNTVIWDTTSSKMGVYIEDKEYEKKCYRFASLADVEEYWLELSSVCLQTRLKLQQLSNPIRYPTISLTDRTDEIKLEDGPLKDDGNLPGDNKGSGGLHSTLFSSHSYNWSKANLFRATHSSMIKSKKTIKSNYDNFRIVKERDRAYKMVAMKLGKHEVRDEVDDYAESLNTMARTRWTAAEDTVLLICRIALLYLDLHNKNSMCILGTRDIIHWTLNELHKTSVVCQRRTKKLISNPITYANVKSCLEDIRQNEEITRKFGPDLAVKLKELYPDNNEYSTAIKVNFVKLYHILSGMYSKLSSNELKKTAVSVLPDKYEDFWNEFRDIEEKVVFTREPETIDEIKIMTVYNVIYSSMCCAQDKASYTMQLLDIYKHFPELILNSATTRIRSDSVISTNKLKNFQDGVPLGRSPIHLATSYTSQMQTGFSYEIFNRVWQRLKEMRRGETGNLKHIDYSMTFLLSFIVAEDSNRIKLELMEHTKLSAIKREPNLEKRPTKRNVSFDECPEVIEFNYEPLEILLKINPLNYHIICFLNKQHLTKGMKQSMPQIKISENVCQFDCMVEKLEYLEDLEKIILQSGIVSYQREVKKILSDLAPLKAALIEDNKRDLGKNPPQQVLSVPALLQTIVDKCDESLNQVSISIYFGEVEHQPVFISKEEIKEKLLKISICKPVSKESQGELESNPIWNTVLNFIEKSKEFGVTGNNVLKNLKIFHENQLETVLKDLLKHDFIMIFGVDDFRFVHHKHAEPWLIRTYHLLRLEREAIEPSSTSNAFGGGKKRKLIEPKTEVPEKIAKVTILGEDEIETQPPDTKTILMRPYPWIRVSGSLNQRVVDKWLGTVILYLMEKSGTTMISLMKRFAILNGVHLKLLVGILMDMECVTLKRVSKTVPTLFSTYSSPESGKESYFTLH